MDSRAAELPRQAQRLTAHSTVHRTAIAVDREGHGRNVGFGLQDASGEIFRGKLPVDQLVQDRMHMVRAPVLVVEIVGVFPDVDRQQRLEALRQRVIAVAGADHPQVRPIEDPA